MINVIPHFEKQEDAKKQDGLKKQKDLEKQEGALNIFPCAHDLLNWYDTHRRHLPWRSAPYESADPYAVWLSEIMLQQTTVAAVKPYFLKFLSLWPRVENLASAPVDTVMQQWAGLGYYSRARNLHLCAQHVVNHFGGQFPKTESELLKLPGVGPYTAAAIASIAFNIRAVVVDGNVERVITRLHALETPMPMVKAAIKKHADDLTPFKRAGDFAQAMMDLGATICTPRKPTCALCPFFSGCKARHLGLQERFPVKAPKHARPTRYGAAFIVVRGDKTILARRRPPKGLLGGMLEVPTTDWSSAANAEMYKPDLALEAAPLEADWQNLGVAEHVFTHFTLKLDVFLAYCDFNADMLEGHNWIDPAYNAFPTVFKKVLAKAQR